MLKLRLEMKKEYLINACNLFTLKKNTMNFKKGLKIPEFHHDQDNFLDQKHIQDKDNIQYQILKIA